MSNTELEPVPYPQKELVRTFNPIISGTNFDCTWDDGAEELLKKETNYIAHYARNFCGYVWFKDGMFHEEVWRYRAPVETISAESLTLLMDAVNDKYGSS